MRTLLLIAVMATSVAITTSAEAQWIRSRRTTECANGQCSPSSVRPVASEEAPAAEAAPEIPAPVAGQPAVVEQANRSAPAPARVANPAEASSDAPAVAATQTSVAGSRTATVNNGGNGRLWRRIGSRR